ncbi:TPA: acyltransferase family protein [Aeromonas hydrophila]|uniref:acyltransferase family protein n=1 Tax=Aeromonas hydrophila TaxID=644 RepID=UPI0038CFA997
MSSVNHELKYRPDIDALRAIAVISVVIYHFSKSWLPGGFVGVDIFFVISGFLISGILIKSVEGNTFSLAGFYLRRVRRILPATIFCIFITTLFCSSFFIPSDGLSLAKSAMAALLSFSNIFFWKSIDTSYFAPSADTLPLLHTWSLGVEEQFYLIWPLIILFLAKWNNVKWIGGVAVILATMSFFIGEHFIVSDQSFSYYMLPARAGELFVGSITYIISNKIGRLSRWFAQLTSILGLSMIVYSLCYFHKNMGFPGYYAIIPALGSSFFILGGLNQSNIINKAFSAKPIVFIGLISFSLYLWHWPVLAFARYAYTELDSIVSIYCAIIIVVMTLISYYFVEIPFRRDRYVGLKYCIITASFTLAAGLSFFIINNNGTLGINGYTDYSKKLSALKSTTSPAFAYQYNCQMGVYDDSVFNDERCITGTSSKPSFIAVGDSNVAHYVGYLRVVAQSVGGTFKNYSHSSCVPFAPDVIYPYVVSEIFDSCVKYNKKIRQVIDEEQYKTVFIGATWNDYFKLVGEDKFRVDFSNMLSEFTKNDRTVIIASKVPIFPTYDLKCQEKNIRLPYINCGHREGYFSNVDIEVNNVIKDVVSKNDSVHFFSVRDSVCINGFCSPYLRGVPLYFDSMHLSMEGSIHLGEEDVSNNKIPKYLYEALR